MEPRPVAHPRGHPDPVRHRLPFAAHPLAWRRHCTHEVPATCLRGVATPHARLVRVSHTHAAHISLKQTLLRRCSHHGSPAPPSPDTHSPAPCGPQQRVYRMLPVAAPSAFTRGGATREAAAYALFLRCHVPARQPSPVPKHSLLLFVQPAWYSSSQNPARRAAAKLHATPTTIAPPIASRVKQTQAGAVRIGQARPTPVLLLLVVLLFLLLLLSLLMQLPLERERLLPTRHNATCCGPNTRCVTVQHSRPLPQWRCRWRQAARWPSSPRQGSSLCRPLRHQPCAPRPKSVRILAITQRVRASQLGD